MTRKSRPELIGQKFGRLTVEKEAIDKRGKTVYHCRCECGGSTVTEYTFLRRSHAKSCGCISIEKAALRVQQRNSRRSMGRVGLNLTSFFGEDEDLI